MKTGCTPLHFPLANSNRVVKVMLFKIMPFTFYVLYSDNLPIALLHKGKEVVLFGYPRHTWKTPKAIFAVLWPCFKSHSFLPWAQNHQTALLLPSSNCPLPLPPAMLHILSCPMLPCLTLPALAQVQATLSLQTLLFQPESGCPDLIESFTLSDRHSTI